MAAYGGFTQKTTRRTRLMAEAFAEKKRNAGHTNVVVRKVTATDWSITWTEKMRWVRRA